MALKTKQTNQNITINIFYSDNNSKMKFKSVD